ncbi:MAG: aldo/keto reductase [Eggerthellaceae bacterium]
MSDIRTDHDFAQLGFGLMRLPQLEEGGNDIEETKKLVDAFMVAGFTYFDTAPTYHGGTSEIAAKEALVDRYPRESFQLATKMPAWAAKSLEEAQAFFNRSLERTGAGYFDYYLLHQLTDEFAPLFEDYDLWNFAQKKKEEGLIRHLGFSFHDSAEVLERLLEEHPNMDFVQLQMTTQTGKATSSSRANATKWRVPRFACDCHGARERRFARAAAAASREILRAQDPEASWRRGRCVSAPPWGVIAVLSGMTTMDQMQDNLRTMKRQTPHRRRIRRDRPRPRRFPPSRRFRADCRYCMKVARRHPHSIIMDSLDIMAKFGDMHGEGKRLNEQ